MKEKRSRVRKIVQWAKHNYVWRNPHSSQSTTRSKNEALLSVAQNQAKAKPKPPKIQELDSAMWENYMACYQKQK